MKTRNALLIAIGIFCVSLIGCDAVGTAPHGSTTTNLGGAPLTNSAAPPLVVPMVPDTTTFTAEIDTTGYE